MCKYRHTYIYMCLFIHTHTYAFSCDKCEWNRWILQSSFKTCFIIPVNLVNPVTFKTQLKLCFLPRAASAVFHERKITNIHPDKRIEIKSNHSFVFIAKTTTTTKVRIAFCLGLKWLETLKVAVTCSLKSFYDTHRQRERVVIIH